MTKTTRTVSGICERLRLVADSDDVNRLKSALAVADGDFARSLDGAWTNEIAAFQDARKAVQKQLDKLKAVVK